MWHKLRFILWRDELYWNISSVPEDTPDIPTGSGVLCALLEICEYPKI